GRTRSGRRGVDRSVAVWISILDRRAASIEGDARASGGGCREGRVTPARVGGGGQSRDVLPRGSRGCSAAACEIARAASGDELEPTVGPAGKDQRSMSPAGRGLSLVHRGVRHGRSERGEIAAGGTGAPAYREGSAWKLARKESRRCGS